jgi:hypothetical protein
MKTLKIALLFLAITSCTTSSDIVLVDKETYFISQSGGFGETLSKLKNEVLMDAKNFCNNKNKEFALVSENTVGFPPFVEIQFSCNN